MTVSVTARALAEAVIAARPASTPRQRLLLEQLRLLPLYNEIGDLAIWDEAYHAAMPDEDDTSEIGRLIEAVYEFATGCFYGAFRADLSLSDYRSACKCLHAAGISCPVINEFTDI